MSIKVRAEIMSIKVRREGGKGQQIIMMREQTAHTVIMSENKDTLNRLADQVSD